MVEDQDERDKEISLDRLLSAYLEFRVRVTPARTVGSHDHSQELKLQVQLTSSRCFQAINTGSVQSLHAVSAEDSI